MNKTYGELPKDSEGRKRWIVARMQELSQLLAMMPNDERVDNAATTLFGLQCLLEEELDIKIPPYTEH